MMMAPSRSSNGALLVQEPQSDLKLPSLCKGRAAKRVALFFGFFRTDRNREFSPFHRLNDEQAADRLAYWSAWHAKFHHYGGHSRERYPQSAHIAEYAKY